MSIPEHYGALPGLGLIWAVPALMTFMIALVIDFGMIMFVLMPLEETRGRPRRRRQYYATFVINDTVVIPLLLGLCALAMHRHPQPQGWYINSWWHLLVLLSVAFVSYKLEKDAVKAGQFTKEQELSPSKLWHSIIFVVIGYWMVTGTVAALATRGISTLTLGIIFFWAAWALMVFVMEPHVLYWFGVDGKPRNVHPAWNWNTFRPTWLDDAPVDARA